jgi:hypothetical protein
VEEKEGEKPKHIQPTTMSTTINSNKEALVASAGLQRQTQESLTRIQRDLYQTEEQGAMTLEDLYAQRRRLGDIQKEGDRLHDKLDETDKLQRKLGTWFGGMGRKKKFHRSKPEDSLVQKKNQQQITTGSTNNHDKKKWKSFRKSSKVDSKEDPWPEIIAKKGLLGDNNVEGEHRDELLALASGDDEINAQLDTIGHQLGGLVRMAQQIGEETNTQGRMLKTIDTQLEEANHRQKKVNKKTRKLIYK